MQQFIHHRQRRITNLLAALSPLHTRLRAQDPDFERQGSAWLEETASTFEELGLQGRAAVLARLRTEFELTARGVDPQRLTRVETYRRQFRTASWSRVLAQAEAELQEALAPETERLQNAEIQLGKLVLSGLQTGLLDEQQLLAAHDEHVAEQVWLRLAADERFDLVCRQLLLEVISADLCILLAVIARRISPIVPPTPPPVPTEIALVAIPPPTSRPAKPSLTNTPSRQLTPA